MNKFKVGDKIVRVQCPWSDMPLESVRDVSSVTNEEEMQVSGHEGISWLSKYFELVGDELIVNNLADSETKTYNPLIAQEGGGHYKDKGIQPLEYTMQNNLSFCEGNVVKYISRYKSKNGIEDLAKVIHYALLASYEEYGEEGSTKLRDKVLKLLGVGE